MNSKANQEALGEFGRFTDPSVLILSSLAGGDKHGYAMIEDIADMSNVHLGAGTLYGALARLETRGYIKALQSDDRRRPYRLTALGKKVLGQHLREVQRVARLGLERLGGTT
jgi:DNA-binding PadR family transcriptional regulator